MYKPTYSKVVEVISINSTSYKRSDYLTKEHYSIVAVPTGFISINSTSYKRSDVWFAIT